MGGPTKTRPSSEQIRKVMLEIIRSAGGDEIPARAIEAALGARGIPSPSPRTLRRHLAELVESGAVTPAGEGRGRTYRLSAATGFDRELGLESGNTPSLSAAGSAALERVRRPIQQRSPIGYHADFLTMYQPGESWYLSSAERQALAQLGTTPGVGRPAGTFARDIYGRLLIDLSWASSRLEGNTYSRLDTENLLDFGQRAEGKDVQEAQMILNHKSAIALIVDNAEDVQFDRRFVTAIHAALSENLLPDTRDEGRIRTRPVGIGSSTYIPLAIPQKIEEYFELILFKAAAIPDPFEQCFFVMVHIPYLQPFADVNKRTSRLAANIPLVKGNLCPLSFIDVTTEDYVAGVLAIYEDQDVSLLRDLYLWAYERSSAQYRIVRESLGEPHPLRLKYREQIASVVRDSVIALEPPSPSHLRERLDEQGVDATERDRVADIAQEVLMGLSEGAATRYRLLPSEYQRWREQVAISPDRPAANI